MNSSGYATARGEASTADMNSVECANTTLRLLVLATTNMITVDIRIAVKWMAQWKTSLRLPQENNIPMQMNRSLAAPK